MARIQEEMPNKCRFLRPFELNRRCVNRPCVKWVELGLDTKDLRLVAAFSTVILILLSARRSTALEEIEYTT